MKDFKQGHSIFQEATWGLLAIFFFSLSLYLVTTAANNIQLSFNLSNLGSYYFSTDSNLALSISLAFATSTSFLFLMLIFDYSPSSFLQFVHDMFLIFQGLPLVLLVYACRLHSFTPLLFFLALALFINQEIPKSPSRIPLLFQIPLSYSLAIFLSVYSFLHLAHFSEVTNEVFFCASLFLVVFAIHNSDPDLKISLHPKLWLSSSISWTIGNLSLFFFSIHLPQRTIVFSSMTHLLFRNVVLFLILFGAFLLAIGFALQIAKRELSPDEIQDLYQARSTPVESQTHFVDRFSTINQQALYKFVADEIRGKISQNSPKNFVWMERLRIATFMQTKATSNSDSADSSLKQDEIETIQSHHPLLSEVSGLSHFF